MGDPVRQVKYVTLGNMFTASRLVLLPIGIAGIAHEIGWLTAAAMALALITDLLDGRVSRRMGTASEFGANLDSIVDFLFLNLFFIAFYATHEIRTYQFIVVYISLLATLATQFITTLVSSQNKVAKTKYSKPAGAFQYLYLLFLGARLVLPPYSALKVVDVTIFALIVVFVALHVYECVALLRVLSKPQTSEGH